MLSMVCLLSHCCRIREITPPADMYSRILNNELEIREKKPSSEEMQYRVEELGKLLDLEISCRGGWIPGPRGLEPVFNIWDPAASYHTEPTETHTQESVEAGFPEDAPAPVGKSGV